MRKLLIMALLAATAATPALAQTAAENWRNLPGGNGQRQEQRSETQQSERARSPEAQQRREERRQAREQRRAEPQRPREQVVPVRPGPSAAENWRNLPGGNRDGRWSRENRDWNRDRNDGRWRDGDRNWDRNRDGRVDRDDRRWDRDGDRRWRDNDRRWDRDGDRRWDRDNDRRWDRDNDRRWDHRAWRNDRRYDWRRYREYNRHVYRPGRYYVPYGWNYGYRRYSIGITLNSLLFGSRYWIDDPWQYRLPPAYGPYRWIRYYDDVLLVDMRSGYVVDVIHDFFW